MSDSECDRSRALIPMQGGQVKDISSIPLAVELHGRWHVMTPSIELPDGVRL